MSTLEQHLETYHLLELHQEAQLVGYRVRVANDCYFEFEYVAGLPKYQQPDYRIKRFDTTETGQLDARAFLENVRKEIEQFPQNRQTEWFEDTVLAIRSMPRDYWAIIELPPRQFNSITHRGRFHSWDGAFNKVGREWPIGPGCHYVQPADLDAEMLERIQRDGFPTSKYTFRLQVLGEEQKLLQAQHKIEERYGEGCVENAGNSLRITLTLQGWHPEYDGAFFGDLYHQGLIMSVRRYYVKGNPIDEQEIPETHSWCGKCVGYYRHHEHQERKQL